MQDAKPRTVNLPILSLYELYATCDIISLHVPVTAETTHMIDMMP
jgi:phosphoglycerate dehydrogenase-like enzyme